MTKLTLLPLGTTLEAAPGTPLDSLLPTFGVEFPCGGAGICRGCRVRVISGQLAVSREMEEVLTPAELAAGWRLACCAHVEGSLTLEVGQWETPVLTDDSAIACEPVEGVGIAIDLGTTTLVAQAVDLATAHVLAVETALNPQTAHGADVMSRIEFALAAGAAELASSIRAALARMIQRLAHRDSVRAVAIAGNTAMHHFFCGIDVGPLAHVPFQPSNDGEQIFHPRDLGWDLPGDAQVRFLPCLGGFVGSDLLAGIVATGICDSSDLRALIDLGTNGEIVLGNRERILCASTAAGPAFEAGGIRMGMRAAAGAISHVAVHTGALTCRTIGDETPRGICGSGLVDAVAAGLDLGAILPSGRLADGAREFPLAGPVSITRGDVRQLQLAKGAVAAGLRILLARWGVGAEVRTLYLAGAFGNYVNIASARRIGLLEMDTERIVPSGNTALRGAKMLLLCGSKRDDWIAGILARTEHVPLAEDPQFQDTFVDAMPFGAPT